MKSFVLRNKKKLIIGFFLLCFSLILIVSFNSAYTNSNYDWNNHVLMQSYWNSNQFFSCLLLQIFWLESIIIWLIKDKFIYKFILVYSMDKVKVELEKDLVNQLIKLKSVGDTYSDVINMLLIYKNKGDLKWKKQLY